MSDKPKKTSAASFTARPAGGSRIRDVASLVKAHEGLRLKPYADTTGHLTIGWGHNLDLGIPIEVADDLFRRDLRAAEDALDRALPWAASLDAVRRAVLIDMAFNLGVRGLRTFTRTLAHVEAGRYAEAAEAMLASRWAEQVGQRATRLARMMRTGEWP